MSELITDFGDGEAGEKTTSERSRVNHLLSSRENLQYICPIAEGGVINALIAIAFYLLVTSGLVSGGLSVGFTQPSRVKPEPITMAFQGWFFGCKSS